MTFEEELREETPPPDDYMEEPGDYMEEGEEAKEFGFVEREGKETKENNFFVKKH